MTLPSQRWLAAVVLATALVFTGVAVYLYGFRFFAWIESDAAVTAVLGAKALHAKLPIVATWYYANGDVWLAAPHLLAILPVAILGLGPASLLVSVLIGFALEIYVLVRCYLRLGGERWVAGFATMVTLMAWSTSHVAYGYIQLSYAFLTMLCILSFTAFGVLVEGAARRWQWIAAGFLVTFVSLQNPTRTLAFIFAPVIAGCCWPWHGFPLRRRMLVASTAVIGFGLAFVLYAKVLVPNVAFSSPRGHLDFALVGVAGIKTNLARFAEGLSIMCGGGGARALPGLAVIVGALVLVTREVLSSRALTALRFVCLLVLGQLGIVLVPLVFGNLLVDIASTRYVLPSLLEVFGLAAILAVREIASASWVRKLAVGWLVAVPIAAIVAIPGARPPSPERYVWPDAPELEKLADELVQRGLGHGYANVLSANLLILDTRGRSMTCPIYFRDIIIPQRWLADTSCFTATALPEKFFIIADQTDHDRKAILATLPPPLEKFSVGPTYEVYVYPTAGTPMAWLELPLPDNDKAAFPMRIAATHLQLQHGKVLAEGTRLVATGETGTVVYGPYVKFPRGRYVVHWNGSGIASPGEIKFLVTADGKDVLAETSMPAIKISPSPGELAKVAFKIPAPREAIELVVYSQDGGRVALDEIVIERK